MGEKKLFVNYSHLDKAFIDEAQPKNLLFHKPLEKQMLRFRSA